jgi:nitroimidazol reductase NimA-like FMN-containing flavoprotein (pyridoxamine 5'-phosphate oxidase superfamily)
MNMFRPMRRWKQQLSDEDCAALLKNTPRGILSVLGEDGYPYGIPMNHWYCEADGKLYFHGAKTGHKIDAISQCDKVSYCVHDEGYREDGQWPLHIKSVVVFGRIQPVKDAEKELEICTHLCQKFTDDKTYLEHELQHSRPNVLCLALTPEHMTGKLVKES